MEGKGRLKLQVWGGTFEKSRRMGECPPSPPPLDWAHGEGCLLTTSEIVSRRLWNYVSAWNTKNSQRGHIKHRYFIHQNGYSIAIWKNKNKCVDHLYTVSTFYFPLKCDHTILLFYQIVSKFHQKAKSFYLTRVIRRKVWVNLGIILKNASNSRKRSVGKIYWVTTLWKIGG